MPNNQENSVLQNLYSELLSIKTLLQPQLPSMDFAAESLAHIAELKAAGRTNTADSYRRSLNRFLDYAKTSQI
ncbi:MAG: hypothetical protein J6U21_07475, partial [Bacteroidales bacterium]|nr:hypothetical protein [Bacteroidales bacterium]